MTKKITMTQAERNTLRKAEAILNKYAQVAELLTSDTGDYYSDIQLIALAYNMHDLAWADEFTYTIE